MESHPLMARTTEGLVRRADEIVVLVDSSKFASSSGAIVCGLDEVDVLITDAGINSDMRAVLEDAGLRLIIA